MTITISFFIFFFLMTRRPPKSPLFPYTTLFRSSRAVHRHKLHKHVRFFGFVSDQTLAALYRLADVFVFPSLYEGVGLPPPGAMASGTPVITSNGSSLPELGGRAAPLIAPFEPQAVAHATQ